MSKARKFMDKVRALIIALNSSGPNLFPYPIGNPQLTATVKEFESMGLIKFDKVTGLWTR